MPEPARYDPYRYLPWPFARAVAAGILHLWCEFCLHAHPRRGCGAGEDPASAWAGRECPGYREATETKPVGGGWRK